MRHAGSRCGLPSSWQLVRSHDSHENPYASRFDQADTARPIWAAPAVVGIWAVPAVVGVATGAARDSPNLPRPPTGASDNAAIKTTSDIGLIRCSWLRTVSNVDSALASDEKTCPDCAETVKAAAKVCRFCGHGFTDQARADRRAGSDGVARSRSHVLAAVTILGVAAALIAAMVLATAPEPRQSRNPYTSRFDRNQSERPNWIVPAVAGVAVGAAGLAGILIVRRRAVPH